MTLKFGKYAGKTLEEVSQTDVHYLIWMYWETICRRFGDEWWEKACEIEKAIKGAGKTIFDKKEFLLEKIAFGKHKGKKFEEIIEKEGKWFLWMYNEAQDKDKINKSLVFTLKYWMTKNGCTLFDGSKGMRHCPSCKGMHN